MNARTISRAIKGAAQLFLALLALTAALVFCVGLGATRVVTWVWEILDQFLRAAFNTELRDFFKPEDKR